MKKIFFYIIVFFILMTYGMHPICCEENIVIENILCQKAEIKYPDRDNKEEGEIIKINFNQPVECNIFELADPYKIVVDPQSTVLAKFKERKIDLKEGIVSAIAVVESQEETGLKYEAPYFPVDFIVISPLYPVKYKLVKKGNTACVYLGDIDESVDNR